MLENLIKGLSSKSKTQTTAILIDEYDWPVSYNLGNKLLAEENSAILKEFYAKL
jgi:hypothetical protein